MNQYNNKAAIQEMIQKKITEKEELMQKIHGIDIEIFRLNALMHLHYPFQQDKE